MDLEKLLADDRVKFETTLAPLSNDKARQDAEALILFNELIKSCEKSREQLTYIKPRVDAFMHYLVKYGVGPMAALHVLRGTVSSAGDFPNRPELADYAKTFPAPKLFEFDASSSLTDRANVSKDTLLELKGLCDEHADWLDRMRLLAPMADPKNHPDRRQLRERDAIRVKINELATPAVISELVRVAMNGRGEM
jgi:hypothetical protein